MDVIFELATADDDAAIRRLLATSPVPGAVTLTYEREPSYFAGCATIGPFCQVLVARDRASGDVVGLACRAARRLFVNGQAEEVGYLSQLRVDARFRGRWLVSRGFEVLRNLHGDGRVAGYLATVTQENREALGILIDRRRRHFPAFRPVERLCTLAVTIGRSKPEVHDGCRVERAAPGDVPEIVGFFNRHGRAKQFFPVYIEEDFGGGPIVSGFRDGDFIVARRGGAIAGVVRLWDQSRFKQTVVRGYTGPLKRARPLYNAYARLRGRQPLPAPGEQIRLAYASFVCVQNDDPTVFRALLRHAYNLAAARRYAHLVVGLSARDPLLSVARTYAHIPYHSTLYTACWEDGGDFHERLDDRVPYAEVAAL
jgi:hypothetical protein